MKKNEKWWFYGTPIKVVEFCKYLGVSFTSSLNWSMCKKTLSLPAKKRLYMFYKHSYQCGVLPKSIVNTLFDKIILPIVLMGRKCGASYTQKYMNQFSMIFAEELQMYRLNLAY